MHAPVVGHALGDFGKKDADLGACEFRCMPCGRVIGCLFKFVRHPRSPHPGFMLSPADCGSRCWHSSATRVCWSRWTLGSATRSDLLPSWSLSDTARWHGSSAVARVPHLHGDRREVPRDGRAGHRQRPDEDSFDLAVIARTSALSTAASSSRRFAPRSPGAARPCQRQHQSR